MRSFGVFSSQPGSAFLAAATARLTSSPVQLGTSAITSPVAGLSTSIVSPLAESTHSPPMKFLYLVADTLTPVLPDRRKPAKEETAGERIAPGRSGQGIGLAR